MVATDKTWIQKTPGVVGGDARVRNTRIAVWIIVEMHDDGMTDEEILNCYPSLRPADLAACWNYSAANRDEIEIAIRENECA